MLRRLILMLSISSALAVSVIAETGEVRVAGVVTKVDAHMVEVRTDHQKTRSITVGPDTRYLKWIMAKPWQQDPRMDARFLHVGSRVHIELAPASPQTARTVWIVVGRPGFD